MDPAHDVTGRRDIHDVDDALARRFGGRMVELREPDAGRCEDQESEERDPTEDVADPVCVRGNRVREPRETKAFIDRVLGAAPATPDRD